MDNIFQWEVTYHSTEKVDMDGFDMYDIKENKDISVYIPNMEYEYEKRNKIFENRKTEVDPFGEEVWTEDFCIQVEKNQLGEILPHEQDIIYFKKLENLYQIIDVKERDTFWTLMINKYTVKRYLNWELN